MRLIEKAPQLEYPPRACAVTNRIDGDFIDFQKYFETLEGPFRLYVHRGIIEEAARLCGMVNGDQVGTLIAQVDQLGAEIDELKKDLDLYQRIEERFGNQNGEGI